MAVLAFAAAGALIAPAGYAGIGWAIGSFVGNALFPAALPDQNVTGPRLSDLRVQTSAYGQMVPIIGGTVRVAGNLIWANPVREVQTTTSQTSGGKGGGSGQTVNQTAYAYYADFAVLLAEGEIGAVRKIWINGELKYNVDTAASVETIFASALTASAVRFYPGSETQEPDALIAAHVGADDCPAYRGDAYMVVEGMDVTGYGGRPPQLEFELIANASTSNLAVPTVANLGTAEGATNQVLGGNGNVYAGETTVGGNVNRFNFYAGAKASTYPPPSYTYIPAGVTPAGDCIATGSFAGVLAVLHQDGGVSRYTGGFANMGSGGTVGVLAESANNIWWCRGDSVSSTRLFRTIVDHDARTLQSTLLSGFDCNALARNGVAIAGRCYILGSYTVGGQNYIGYVNAESLSFVALVAITGYAGFLVSRGGSLWFGPNNSPADRDEIHQYSADGVLLQTITLPSTASAGWGVFEDQTGLIWAVGFTGFGSNRRAYCINPSTGEIISTSQDFLGTPLGFTADNRFVVWDLVTGSNVLKEIERLARVTAATSYVSGFIESLLARVGLAPTDLDLSAVDDELRGYAIARRDSVRSAIEPLGLAYGFDLIETDDQLRAVKRGGSPVVVIPEEDLAARAFGSAPPPPIANARQLETELPREVSVRYIDAAADYAVGTQYARRLTGQSQHAQTIDLPIVLAADEAAAIADRWLYEAWTARNTQDVTLSHKYAWLDPADVFQAIVGARVYVLRIAASNYANGLLKLRTEMQDVGIYTPGGAGAALPLPSGSVGPAGPTELRLLDIPILRDADDAPGIYAAAAGYYAGWHGAELWVSGDSGATYVRTTTAFLVASVMGSAVTALPNFTGGNIFDELSTVDVQVFGGELAGDTEANVLAGANAAYLGGELIQFRDATLLSSGKYRLTGFLRARRGTEQYMATHAIGEPFVLLSAATIARVAGASADIGTPRTYKAPGFGQALTDAAAIAFTDSGVALKPLAPVQLGGGRNAAGDVLGSFMRRSRVGGEWRDYVDAQLGEGSEAYEVEIWTAGFAALKRTLTGLTTPAFTYTSAQQVTDFGSNQATVYVRVYQLSAVVGRGFALQGTV